MPGYEFLTVGDDLLECANAAADNFSERGFKIRIEHSELNYPFTPTLVCKRKSTTVIVEVHQDMPMKRLEEWARYAGSCSRDTEVAIVVPPESTISVTQEIRLREVGIGIYRASRSQTMEIAPPKDLALLLQLPEKKDLPLKLRKVLGSAYEQFDRSHWREGFEEACQALESEARKYLKRHVKSRRITFLDSKGKPKTVTEKQIEKMTMGMLKDSFQNIKSQNRADSVIGEVLDQINKDRIGVVHHKAKAATESKLRKNVGGHMWSIVAALRVVFSPPK